MAKGKGLVSLQIFWSDAGVPGNARKHSGADFFAVAS